MRKMSREYAQAGVDYTKAEIFRKAMQAVGKRTLISRIKEEFLLTRKRSELMGLSLNIVAHILIAGFRLMRDLVIKIGFPNGCVNMRVPVEVTMKG